MNNAASQSCVSLVDEVEMWLEMKDMSLVERISGIEEYLCAKPLLLASEEP